VQGSLIAVGIDVDNEVGNAVGVEGQDTDIAVINNVESQGKSKL